MVLLGITTQLHVIDVSLHFSSSRYELQPWVWSYINFVQSAQYAPYDGDRTGTFCD